MPRRLTQEEAKTKSESVGVNMIREYKGVHIKITFECPYCNKLFLTTPKKIWCKHTQSCGCNSRDRQASKRRLSYDDLNNRLSLLGFIMTGKYKNYDTPTTFICKHCGNEFETLPHSILSGKTKSCGCNTVKFIREHHIMSQNDAIQKTIMTTEMTLIGEYNGRIVKTIFKCKCGKYFYNTPNSIWNHNTTSCGHCTDPNVGDVFNFLTVIEVLQNKKVGCHVKCRCKCGNTCIIKASAIKRGNNKSCGNCKVHRNGQFTSMVALKLHNMIDPDMLFSIHNYKILECNFRVDIGIQSLNIAIEYDEWYYHGHKQQQDKRRYKKLLKSGWKLLRIKAHNNLPTQQLLDKCLFDLIMTDAKQRTITLPGWGKGPTRKKKELVAT